MADQEADFRVGAAAAALVADSLVGAVDSPEGVEDFPEDTVAGAENKPPMTA